ncbi:MAG: hypothetical protein WCE79_30110 [Xanthobacteraceae bacterium]
MKKIVASAPTLLPHSLRLCASQRADIPVAAEFEARVSRLIRAESYAITSKLMMELLLPAAQNSAYDEAMIAIALAEKEFTDPLSHNEVTVLACVLYMEHLGKSADYNDVLRLTYRFRGKEMNATTVYNTFRGLTARKLLNVKGREKKEDDVRPSTAYGINERGKEAFRLAVLNTRQLAA